MIANIWDCKWSSDYFYRTNFKDTWIDIDLVLNMIIDDRKEAIQKYCFFMNEIMQEKEEFEDVDIVGEEAYKKMMKTTKEKSKREDLDVILNNIGVNEEQFLLIKNGSRKRGLTPFKIKHIEVALQYQYPLKKIGENIRITQTSVWEFAQKIKVNFL
jgi:putative transposase